MMGGKAARNMYSSSTNKIGIQCICWFYSQGSERCCLYIVECKCRIHLVQYLGLFILSSKLKKASYEHCSFTEI